MCFGVVGYRNGPTFACITVQLCTAAVTGVKASVNTGPRQPCASGRCSNMTDVVSTRRCGAVAGDTAGPWLMAVVAVALILFWGCVNPALAADCQRTAASGALSVSRRFSCGGFWHPRWREPRAWQGRLVQSRRWSTLSVSGLSTSTPSFQGKVLQSPGSMREHTDRRAALSSQSSHRQTAAAFVSLRTIK